jgi:hypothetical protein
MMISSLFTLYNNLPKNFRNLSQRAEFCKEHLTWLTSSRELDIVADVTKQQRCVLTGVVAAAVI